MSNKIRSSFHALMAAVLTLAAGAALADINVGVTVSATGPAASPDMRITWRRPFARSARTTSTLSGRGSSA